MYIRCIIDEQLKRVKGPTKESTDEYRDEFEKDDNDIEVIPLVIINNNFLIIHNKIQFKYFLKKNDLEQPAEEEGENYEEKSILFNCVLRIVASILRILYFQKRKIPTRMILMRISQSYQLLRMTQS